MHLNSRLLFQRYAAEWFHTGKRVLEIGPDGFPSTYQSLLNGTGDLMHWDTLDLRGSDQFRDGKTGVTYVEKDEYSWSVPDASYDIVLSGQVLEHVRMPWRWMREVSRILKPGGLVITVIPASWPYHEAPVDCWRAFAEGMKALYEDSGLKVILAVSESLETPQFKRHIPGRSEADQPRKIRMASKALGRLGFPVEASVDTIAIGQKQG